ncbi:MAG TPA: ABC transporter ATP-binding protein [Acidobacteriaceae bacterium]|nr:ABC transporter ATP-binding protein [Acidobacteriaceae bacterium]
MSGAPLLSVHLDATYAGRAVLQDVCLDLERGEVLGLVGASGAGKSTLVLSLLGLLPWRGGRVSGEVLLQGENLLQMRERTLRTLRGRAIGFIPQSPMSALNPALSVERHFKEAWLAHQSRTGAPFGERMKALLNEVQLPSNRDFLIRRPGQISVGQAQRVLIALALLHEPALLVADEPTSALDPATQTQIVDLLRRLNRTLGVSLLYVSHDLISLLGLCHRIAVLEQGTIVECLHVNDLGSAQHPATRRLLDTLPVPVDVLLRYRSAAAVEDYCSTAAH